MVYLDFVAQSKAIDKKLLEELIPIRRWLKFKQYPESYYIKLNGGHEKGDAKLFNDKDVLVETLEVTHLPRAQYYKDRLIISGKWKERPVRESFTIDDLLRQKGMIENLNGYIETVIAQITKKKNNNYPKGTTLIVSLADEMALEIDDRFEAVVAAVKIQVITALPFQSIYLTVFANSQGFELQETG